MSTQAVFTPNPPFLVSVLYDSTVREALDAIWEFLKSDFQRRDIALNQLSLRALVCDPYRSMRYIYKVPTVFSNSN